MKKIDKVIAGLGVVAGLGVAALPLAAYAADTIVSVTVTSDDNTGNCTDTTCTGGGNDGDGYTITITDKDGTKFRLADNTVVADNSGSTTGGFAPIATATATAPASWTTANTYGVKFNAQPAATGGYTGVLTGTLAAGNNANYVPVSATLGTFITPGAGMATVSHDTGEKHDSSIATGTYTNTLTIVWSNN